MVFKATEAASADEPARLLQAGRLSEAKFCLAGLLSEKRKVKSLNCE
jgi:hypothetical protein